MIYEGIESTTSNRSGMVLILILMEYDLRDVSDWNQLLQQAAVLILILMEGTL